MLEPRVTVTPMRLIPITVLCAAALAAQPSVSFGGENMRLRSAAVAQSGAAWNVDLVMENDNGNASLPASFRRWWHCQIASLSTSGETLNVVVRNAGYSDVILPVWSLSTNGTTFGAYVRVPTSATPRVSGSTHRFTLQTPPGVVAVRLAKYFPYTTVDKATFLSSLAAHPSGRVRSITSLGNSWQGRPIEMIELTDSTVPDPGKRRVWIHAGVHPAETTSYFTVEGLVAFLLSNDPDAGVLMRNTIFDIVPMANPDGVFLGNYRTNSRSVEIESKWAAPYNNTEREVVALRTRIEQFMGSVANPGANPIEVVLNLHSSHNVSYPFHFRHNSNASWNPTTNNAGVLPSVNALESSWIAAYRARSSFVRLGSTLSSSCSAPSRPFVECMMHDRWSANTGWTNPPNSLAQVMAITFEGTYGRGPGGATWNTTDHYRQAGAEMGRALRDIFGFQLTTTAVSYGLPCRGLIMNGQITMPGGNNAASLGVFGAPPLSPGALAIGVQRAVLPLPTPWICNLLTLPLATVPFATSSIGTLSLSLPIPASSGLTLDFQAVVADLRGATVELATSNGIEVQNQF